MYCEAIQESGIEKVKIEVKNSICYWTNIEICIIKKSI